MKRTRNVFAALAASATTLAFAQSAPELEILRQATVEQKPVLSEQTMISVATGARGPNLEVANAIAQQLSADPLAKSSKITVGAEEKRILLTGVTPTTAQMTRAVEIATQLAGEGNVVNGIVTEQVQLIAREAGQPAQAAEASQPAQAAEASQPAVAGRPAV